MVPSHLIVTDTNDKKTIRTMKYLYAIVHGAWIVQDKCKYYNCIINSCNLYCTYFLFSSGLTDCLQAGSWIPEEQYEVVGIEKDAILGGPKRARINKVLQVNYYITVQNIHTTFLYFSILACLVAVIFISWENLNPQLKKYFQN